MHKPVQVELQLDRPQLSYSETLGPIIAGGSPTHYRRRQPNPTRKGPHTYFFYYYFIAFVCHNSLATASPAIGTWPKFSKKNGHSLCTSRSEVSCNWTGPNSPTQNTWVSMQQEATQPSPAKNRKKGLPQHACQISFKTNIIYHLVNKLIFYVYF